MTPQLWRLMNGIIKRVVPDRGFGFIAGEDGFDYFFHRDELRGLEFANLKLGERVTLTHNRPEGAEVGKRASSVAEHGVGIASRHGVQPTRQGR